jgi:hypothetical protein
VLTPCRVSWGCRYDPLCADEWRQPCAEALAEGRLRYVYWDSGALVAVAGSGIFPIASDAICDRMPLVGACALAPTSLHAPPERCLFPVALRCTTPATAEIRVRVKIMGLIIIRTD